MRIRLKDQVIYDGVILDGKAPQHGSKLVNRNHFPPLLLLHGNAGH
jgi:hypothetical protein